MEGSRTVAGRYRLLAPLGSGGMGTVWRAHDEVLGREVAVKEVVFPPGLSEADRSVLHERTRREARAAARLDHPSAVTVYDVVEDGGSPYLVLELVEARTLAEVVRDDGPLPPARVAELGLDLLGALEAAHAQGIVHRDVKPSNVLVREDGRVVLTDFGIATTTGDSTLTSTGLLLGSPAYIAPERARGEPPAPASDLWSLGATLYSAVEGHPPFDGGEPLLTVTAVVTGEPQPYVAAGALAPVLDGLLAKDPAERFDAATTRAMLRSAATAPASTAVSTAPVTAPAEVPASTAALDLSEVRQSVVAEQGTAPARPVRVAAPARDGSRTRNAVLAAGAVAVLAAGTALALSLGDEPGGSVAAPSTSTAASPATEPAPAGEGEEEPAPVEETGAPAEEEPDSAPGIPAGWSTDTGGPGWTVALPPGYSATGGGEYVQSGTGRTLRVETGEGQPDAVEDREQQAEDFERRHPTYEEIRIEAADYRGYEAADWEFTYEGLHAINRVFVTPDGTGYSLFFQTPAGDFPDAVSEYEQVVELFQPARG